MFIRNENMFEILAHIKVDKSPRPVKIYPSVVRSKGWKGGRDIVGADRDFCTIFSHSEAYWKAGQ